jgi:hypothetical protein
MNSHSPSPKLQIKINALYMRADELVEAAEIIRSQLPHKNGIWINSMVSQDIGADVSQLVQDVHYIEKTGTWRPRTWPRSGDYKAARRSRNTMGYQIRLDLDNNP